MQTNAKFKKTAIAWHSWQLAGRRWVAALRDDLSMHFPCKARVAGNSNNNQPKEVKPAVFVSYATDEDLRGSHAFCGGEKLLNNLVLLLRRHGYDAWMVSTDGKHSDWLSEHAPFISIEEFRQKLSVSPSARCVTSWLVAEAFLHHCPQFYFWDQELGASARSHFPELCGMMESRRIVRTAGVNRAVQAWHRTMFGEESLLLRQLVDEKYWQPDESRRAANRVGYFDEGEHGEKFVTEIKRHLFASGLPLEFLLLAGSEKEIIAQMQTCGAFVALNTGKSLLWGEGGPMTPQEAMACGTVPVCFDINGPWELIQQNYNGIVVGEFTPGAMAEALKAIYSVPGRREEMSRRCIAMTKTAHTMEARWPAVRRFLDLPE